MATPPKLPPDAFKQPGTEMESPWDVQASAPAPKSARKPLELPTWAGRYPIAAHDHSTQLDMDAAVNEFGLRMPREQAEDEAYRQYLYHPQRGQHAQAALHHLRGMKAAHAAGDMNTARDHSLMFNLHAKALGKQPHEVARDLQSQMQNLPAMTKFKAHRGDAFAVTQPPPQAGTGVISSTPPPQLNKREQEVLHMIYLMGQAVLAKSVIGHIGNPAGAAKQPRKKQTSQDIGVSQHKHTYNPDKQTSKGNYCTTCKQHFDYCPQCDDMMDSKKTPEASEKAHKCGQEGMEKKEMRSSKNCKCVAYKFPHRHGGGKCKETK